MDAQDQALDPVARQLAVNEVTKYLIDMRFHVPLLTPIDFVGYRADLVDIALDDLGGCYLGRYKNEISYSLEKEQGLSLLF